MHVEPFGGDPWDEELLGVAEAVEASADKTASPARRYGAILARVTRGASAFFMDTLRKMSEIYLGLKS